jgi:hypothetical protein
MDPVPKVVADVLVKGLVLQFNMQLAQLQAFGYGANFIWKYDEKGTKFLECTDIALLTSLPPEAIAKAQAEVPDIIKKAEELVVKPLEAKSGPAGG